MVGILRSSVSDSSLLRGRGDGRGKKFHAWKSVANRACRLFFYSRFGIALIKRVHTRPSFRPLFEEEHREMAIFYLATRAASLFTLCLTRHAIYLLARTMKTRTLNAFVHDVVFDFA